MEKVPNDAGFAPFLRVAQCAHGLGVPGSQGLPGVGAHGSDNEMGIARWKPEAGKKGTKQRQRAKLRFTRVTRRR